MSDYADRQSARDREYLEAWQKLSPRERRRLEKAGITGPEAPVYRTHKRDEEGLLERTAAPESTQGDAETDSTTLDDVATALRRLMSELLASARTLDLECISLVLDLDYDGASMTDIARRHGVTRAAVSKKVARYAEALRTGIAPGQRKLTARKAYARRAHRVHQRHV